MNTTKIHEIDLRLDHLEAMGEWLSRVLVHSDNSASHTGTLISVIAGDIRQLLSELCKAETEVSPTTEHSKPVADALRHVPVDRKKLLKLL